MDTTLKSNATVHAKTPEQRVHAINGLTRKISSKGPVAGVATVVVDEQQQLEPPTIEKNHAISGEEQQETQPANAREHHDDIGVDGVGGGPFTRDEIDEEIEKLSDDGAFSDDVDENDGMDIEPVEDEDQADELQFEDEEVSGDFSFFQLIFGKYVMIAIGLIMAIGDLANVKDDRATDVKEMYQLALRYLFGEWTDDEKAEMDAWVVGINIFTDIELETMEKAEICSTDDWKEIIKAENFLKILQTKLMASGKHTTVFLKMQNRVKSVAETFAKAKDSSSTPTIDDYFHSKATGKKEVETRLNKGLLNYLKQQAMETDLCVIKDQRSATIADSMFPIVANMFPTTIRDFNSMDLLGTRKAATADMLEFITEQKVMSKQGAIYQGLKNWRKEQKGVLSAAKNLFDVMDGEQQDILMKKINNASELKRMKSYMFTRGKQNTHYTNGKGKLMDCSKLFEKSSNTDYLIMSKDAEREKDKNSAFLALPDEGFAVDADVLKLLQKYHKHQLKASPESQLAYMQAVLDLFEKFNCSSAQLTDGILTLFREGMIQLQVCAENGRALREQTRRMAKKRASKSRIDVDGGNNSDSESVDSNVTTTTTGTPAASPERKKQKQNDGD